MLLFEDRKRSLKNWLKALLEGLDLIEAWEREREREREFELKKLRFSSQWSGQLSGGSLL
jgi:hypothetical protein